MRGTATCSKTRGSGVCKDIQEEVAYPTQRGSVRGGERHINSGANEGFAYVVSS